MALIKCPECGATISDKAEACPTCGCPKSDFGIGKDKKDECDVENVSLSQQLATTPKSTDVNTPANTGAMQTTNGNSDASQQGCIIGALMAVGLVILIFFMIAMSRSCENPNTGSMSDIDSAAVDVDTVSIDTTAVAVEEEQKNWTYSEDKDELTGKTSYFVELVSENSTTFYCCPLNLKNLSRNRDGSSREVPSPMITFVVETKKKCNHG